MMVMLQRSVFLNSSHLWTPTNSPLTLRSPGKQLATEFSPRQRTSNPSPVNCADGPTAAVLQRHVEQLPTPTPLPAAAGLHDPTGNPYEALSKLSDGSCYLINYRHIDRLPRTTHGIDNRATPSPAYQKNLQL